MPSDDLLHKMQRATNDREQPERPKLAPDIEAVRLRESFAALQVRHEFQPGDIVRQKPQAQLYNGYGDNDLAIVIAVLPEPIFDGGNNNQGSPFFRCPLDLLIGSLELVGSLESPSCTFCIFHVDSRRFEPAPAEVLQLLSENSA